MQFWTLCVLFVALRVTQRFCHVSDVCLRLKSPFRPSATYFDGAKVGKTPGSVSGPTSSGSLALSLIRGPPQRAIHVRLLKANQGLRSSTRSSLALNTRQPTISAARRPHSVGFLHTLGPVRLARRPASHPPDQRQDSAVTYVALCVVSAIVIKKRFRLCAVIAGQA